MSDWTAETPLRIVTGYQAIARRFFEDKGFKHFVLLAADGALEAHPAMGSADIILDLVRLCSWRWSCAAACHITSAHFMIAAIVCCWQHGRRPGRRTLPCSP